MAAGIIQIVVGIVAIVFGFLAGAFYPAFMRRPKPDEKHAQSGWAGRFLLLWELRSYLGDVESAASLTKETATPATWGEGG